MARFNGIPDDEEPLTSKDIASVTGFDERYVIRRLDKARIDLTSVRRIDDGRIIMKTQGGANRILYGVDSGPNGRSFYIGSYDGVDRLINRQTYKESDGSAIDRYNARIYYPSYPPLEYEEQ